MIQFYVELENSSKQLRLQSNKTEWRIIDFGESIQENDYLTHDIYELIKLQNSNGKFLSEGQVYKINPDSSTYDDKAVLYYDIFVQRKTFPKLPSREQLASVIRQGDDSSEIDYSLILNVSGFFELRLREIINISIKDPSIVLRHETSDYVGEDAANDKNVMDKLYLTSLEYWSLHLETGRTNFYSDIPTSKSFDEIMQEIEKVKNTFQDQIEFE